MVDNIFLGRLKDMDERVSLERHKWDCGWYWAFGYIGNRNLHMHISALINHPEDYNPDWTDVGEQFSETWLTQSQWWILRDLFLSAYALKEAAKSYRHGGHQSISAAPYRVISETRATELNADLSTLLDNIWKFLSDAREAWAKDK